MHGAVGIVVGRRSKLVLRLNRMDNSLVLPELLLLNITWWLLLLR